MNFLHRANHRRVEGGRDLWQLSGLGPVAQDNVQVILGITKNGDSTTSLCSLCQGSVTLTVKSCVLMFGWNLLILVCAHHLWPWNGIQPVSITFALSVRCLYTLLRLCPELFCSAGSTVPALSASAPVPYSCLWPLSALSAPCPCVPCAQEHRAGHCTPAVAPPGQDHLPQLLALLLTDAPRVPLAFFGARAHCWPLVIWK